MPKNLSQSQYIDIVNAQSSFTQLAQGKDSQNAQSHLTMMDQSLAMAGVGVEYLDPLMTKTAAQMEREVEAAWQLNMLSNQKLLPLDETRKRRSNQQANMQAAHSVITSTVKPTPPPFPVVASHGQAANDAVVAIPSQSSVVAKMADAKIENLTIADPLTLAQELYKKLDNTTYCAEVRATRRSLFDALARAQKPLNVLDPKKTDQQIEDIIKARFESSLLVLARREYGVLAGVKAPERAEQTLKNIDAALKDIKKNVTALFTGSGVTVSGAEIDFERAWEANRAINPQLKGLAQTRDPSLVVPDTAPVRTVIHTRNARDAHDIRAHTVRRIAGRGQPKP